MWHTACCTSSPGEVVIFGGCTSSVLGDEPVIKILSRAQFTFTSVIYNLLLFQMLKIIAILVNCTCKSFTELTQIIHN